MSPAVADVSGGRVAPRQSFYSRCGGLNVDVAWTCSNQGDLADLLKCTRRRVSEDRLASREDLIEAWRAGAKLHELIERYEVSESRL